jgi:hypothetical protein
MALGVRHAWFMRLARTAPDCPETLVYVKNEAHTLTHSAKATSRYDVTVPKLGRCRNLGLRALNDAENIKPH